MNNFNKVFQAIKKHCISRETDVIDCFDKIAKEANIPIEGLDFYLNCLEEVGLIVYAKNRKHVTITEMGKKRDGLFIT